ncbi:hypothetical protein [Nocardiopsis sp. CA-288880]
MRRTVAALALTIAALGALAAPAAATGPEGGWGDDRPAVTATVWVPQPG